MIILQKWKCPRPEDEQDWFEISLERAIDLLEGSGHWKKGTVQEMFEDGHELWNPIAYFKKKEQ
jgi:hypothetical protein